MMKRSSDNQNPMLSPNGSAHMIDYNNKKAKMDGSANKPSRVVHIRGVPSDVTDPEIVHLGLPFGRMTNLVVSKKKNQALLEMADLASAQSMVSYYGERPPIVRDRTVHVQFSTYDHLKTENTQSQFPEHLVGNIDETKTVLRVIIDNMLYPITIDILKLIFSKYGQVLRIVTYTKNNSFQALIQYADALSAKAGYSALNNQNIYNGCCTLRIDYSHLQTLQVKYNNDKTWDYTNPNLPSGNSNLSDHAGMVDSCGDGILGSYNGALNNFGLSSFGGTQNLSKVGAMAGLGSGLSGGISLGGASGLGGLAGLNSVLGIGAGLLGGPHQPTNTVLIVSNLNEEKVTPDYLFTLFGVYGMVTRVKIMYNKKDTALVQFSDPLLAQNAVTYLDKIKWWGKTLKVSISKHSYIQMPKEGQAETWLTKDYTNSKLHRHSNPNSKNYGSINPPSSTLHIANIPNSMTEDELVELFSKYGSVEASKFLEKEKKMALVQMASVEEAVGALVELHNHQLPGPHYLRVSFTKSTI